MVSKQLSSPTHKEFDSHSDSGDEFGNDGALLLDEVALNEGSRLHRFNSTKNAQQPPKQFHEDHSPSVGDDQDYGEEQQPQL